MDTSAAPSARDVHWLLPITPAAHAEHQPDDWRTRSDATAVWAAIGRSQPLERWCLRSGYRTMRAGDVIWAYLAVRQEVCAFGRVRAVVEADGAWFVDVTWDEHATRALNRSPVARGRFRPGADVDLPRAGDGRRGALLCDGGPALTHRPARRLGRSSGVPRTVERQTRTPGANGRNT